MKYQVTCTIDDSLLAPVVELMAPYGRVVVRLVEGAEKTPPVKAANIPTFTDRLKRRAPAFAARGGMGRIIALRLVAKEATVPDMKAAYKQAGISPHGTGANLSKLKRGGYVRHLDKGVWRLTPKGEAALRRLDAGATALPETADAEEHDVAHD